MIALLTFLLVLACVFVYLMAGAVVGGFLCRAVKRRDRAQLTVASLFFWPAVGLTFAAITVLYVLWRWAAGVKK